MRTVLLILVMCFAVSCGNSVPPTEKTKVMIVVSNAFAFEGVKRWDFLNDEPELYVVVEHGFEKKQSLPQRSGWTIKNDFVFNFIERGDSMTLSIYDDDGENTTTTSSNTIIDSIVNDLLTDHDDLVLKKTILLQEGSGNIKIQNKYGGATVYYDKNDGSP